MWLCGSIYLVIGNLPVFEGSCMMLRYREKQSDIFHDLFIFLMVLGFEDVTI
jgi:hypothetical protein